MSNEEIMKISLRQSAYDCNCVPEDFLSDRNVLTISKVHPNARKYIPLPLGCDLVSYGSNIVAQTSPELRDVVENYLQTYAMEHCFETPNLHVLDEALAPYGLKTCFMAEYFLPDVTRLKRLECGYELRILHQHDLSDLYRPEWSNALCEDRKELDVLAVGAYDGDTLIGLAGCSADCEDMYQIGVDVLPGYRGQGVASALVSRLALEILELGKVPFYCAAWSNLKSVRTALKCGFFPAWVELTAREIRFIETVNRRNDAFDEDEK